MAEDRQEQRLEALEAEADHARFDARLDALETESSGHTRDIAVSQSDIRWIKWLSGAAAASSTANILFGAAPAKAVIAGAVVFLAGVVADVIAHIPR